ncbi:PQQ-binding-like beta-propeller repeat protein [Salinigranum marinum]|uniref:outer membrane protein assembly factor BamB family protein n=1 Tax=Salinigranum marinum TaxID=1515595 RepID=UPI002989B32E|nr:PQQ-binding-like beta-propeller repeat protein [Salinigranum marinum]
MTRLRIYSAGTGRLQFDSSGSAADVTEESVKRDFKSDLLLYYDPGRNGLRCYVKLVRSGSEQFMADYEFDPGTATPIESFKSTLEREIEEVGWRVEDDAGYEQRLYESIGSAGEASPDVPVADLEYLLDAEGQIRIGTPDEARALGVVSYLRRAFDDSLDIAVTYSGETGTHAGVDAVVVPGSTDRVTVTRGQRAVLARRRLRELKQAVPATGVGGGAAAMRRALVDAGAEDRLGLAIDEQEASVPGAAAGQRNAVLTALVLVPLAVLLVVVRAGTETLLPALTRVQGFYLPLAETANGVLPIAVPQYLFDFTSWHVLVVSAVVIGVALVSTPPVQRTVTGLTGFSIPGLGGGSRGGGPTPSDRASAAVDELVALQRTGGDGGAKRDIATLLDEFGLEAGSQSTRARTALAVQAAGLLAGAIGAAVVFVVASQVAGVVFGLLIGNWALVLDLFMFGGVVAVVGVVGLAGVILAGDALGGNRRRSGRSRSPSRSRSTSTSTRGSVGGTGVAGPASRRSGGFDVGSFEKRVETNPHRAASQGPEALEALSAHSRPSPRSKRLANALLTLEQRVPDTEFRLSPSNRKLVQQHADEPSGSGMMDELVKGQPKQGRRDDTGTGTRGDSRAPADGSRRESADGRGESTGGDSGPEPGRDSGPEPGRDDAAPATDDGDADDFLYPAGDDGDDGTVDRLDVQGGDDSGGDVDPFGSRRTTTATDSEPATDADGPTAREPATVGDEPDTQPPVDGDAATESTTGSDVVSVGTTEPAGVGRSEASASDGEPADEATDGNADELTPSVGSPAQEPERTAGVDPTAQVGDASFSQFRYDAANTGSVAGVGRTVRTPAHAWEPVALGEECTTTPVVLGDSLVVGTRAGRLHAISRSAGDHEVVATPGAAADVELFASPAVVRDTVVVVTSVGEVIGYRLADGPRAREAWRADRRVTGPGSVATASPTVADGRLFVAGGEGTVHALDGRNGDAVWDEPYDAGAGITLAAPAVDDGTVYVATDDGTLHAIDAASGAGSWSTRLGPEPIWASPAVADGRLLVGNRSGTLYVVDAEGGAVRRKEAVGDEIVSSAAVHGERAYVVSNVGGRVSAEARGPTDDDDGASASPRAVVTAFDLEGRIERRWETDLDAMTISSPTVAGQGLFLGTNGGRLAALDCRTGESLWDDATDAGTRIESSVAAVDGALYVPDHDGTVWGLVDDHG